MDALTEHEQSEIDRVNGTDRRPVMFIHGLWLLSSSWDRWRALFEEAGYATLAPVWPDDPDTVEEARRDPDVFARKMVKQVTDHYLGAVRKLARKPAVVGHSFGGLIAQKIAGEGMSAATVAVDPAQFRGVLPLPVAALRSVAPVLTNPANLRRSVALTFEQFRYGWANALEEAEARELYDTYHVPAPGAPLFQAASANLNPFSEAKVDTKNPERGPLLVISGEKDHTVPHSVSKAAFRLQKRNEAPTEFVKIPNRGHSLTIDSGWREVAQTALDFIQRRAEAQLAA
jgi:non-heme chloroperoxidase